MPENICHRLIRRPKVQDYFHAGTAGNPHLGGDDFDNRMLAHFSAEFKRKFKKDPSTNARALRYLYAVCERAKRTLSQSSASSVEVDSLLKGRDFQSKIQRDKFEEICADLFQQIILPVEQALKDAELKKGTIDEIVMVGGSSRIPKVQQILQDFFDGRRLNKSINPGEATAYGAAILAAKLSGAPVSNIQSMKLSDITGSSLGIKCKIDCFSIFIPRGSRIPAVVTRRLDTAWDNQTQTSFEVYEGEDSLASNNRFLGSFRIIGHPALPAGKVTFDTVMEVDANGVLHLVATETSTGKKNQISLTRRVVG